MSIRASAPSVDMKKSVQEAQKSKFDGMKDISPQEFEKIKGDFQNNHVDDKSEKWLKANEPRLFEAVRNNASYDDYMHSEIGDSIGHVQQDRRPALDSYQPNGLPKDDRKFRVGEHGVASRASFETGTNTTIADWPEERGKNSSWDPKDCSLNVGDKEAAESRTKQDELCTRMSGVTRMSLSNPPSLAAEKTYLQSMMDGGATDAQVHAAHQEYLDTYYKHIGGSGNILWRPSVTAGNIQERVNDQPVLKDGKRPIDCEAYAAMSEKVLGDLKRNGKPAFDVRQIYSPGHNMTGVFPHGGDPSKGVIYDTSLPRPAAIPDAKDFNLPPENQTKYAAQAKTSYSRAGTPQARQDTLLTTCMMAHHSRAMGGLQFSSRMEDLTRPDPPPQEPESRRSYPPPGKMTALGRE